MVDGKQDAFVDRAMILETNLSAWEERPRLINQAEERIILSTFDMRDGESTKDLLALILGEGGSGSKGADNGGRFFRAGQNDGKEPVLCRVVPS